MQKLSDYARENGLNYKNLWYSVKNGNAPIKTTTTKNGRIYVSEEAKASKLEKFVDNEGKFYTPVLTGKEMSASNTRRNASATSTPTDQYTNIRNGVSPFSSTGGGIDSGSFPLSEAIRLCQLAFHNFSSVRNIISTMMEFSCSNIYLSGGNAKSRNFFENFLDSIGIASLQSSFFTELYRSCNVIIYRFQITAKPEDIAKLNKIYGSSAAESTVLPSKYIILNPCDIGVQSNIVSGAKSVFYKKLNGYEINRLKKPESDEEKAFFNSLSPEVQKQIKSGAGTVLIPLDSERIYGVFFHKLPYESMAVPIIYPVLKDIEWKSEMKRVDMAVARTMQQVVLLVNMGYEAQDGTYMFDSKAAEAMQALFQSESVGKVLVSDFTTKLTWAIPAVGDFLDPKKYEIVNQDIKEGLNYILTGGDSKFANQFISVKLFVEKLKHGRDMFLKEFLIPEMKKISATMGFKSTPTPKFEDIDLRDEAEWERIVTQLTSLGVLTPTEGLDALNTGRLPTAEESLEHQAEYRLQRDKGLYEPLIGGPYDSAKIAKIGADNQAKMQQAKITATPPLSGRPTNIKTKQTTKKVGISRGSDETDISEAYSLLKIKDNLILASKLRNEVKEYFAKTKKIKKFSEAQLAIIDEISDCIIANVKPSDWISNIEKYVKNPVNDNEIRLALVDEIAASHGLDPKFAVYLADATKEDVIPAHI